MARALVLGASGGVGAAVTARLGQVGYEVTALSRTVEGFDITDETSVNQHLSALEGSFDLIFVATGALSSDGGPEKSLRAVTVDEMQKIFMINAVGPALVLRHAPKLLPRNAPSVFAALSARVGSIGDNRLGGWYSYRASKSALNQIIKTASVELARTHKHLACVALHPGTVRTEFTKNYPQHDAVAPSQAAENLVNVVTGLTAADTGSFFDWAGQPVAW